MSDKINIEAILEKHHEGLTLADDIVYTENNVKAAIKEIVEAVIDKCAEEASISSYNPHTEKEPENSNEFIYVSDPNGPDTVHYLDRDSILQVKNLVQYE